MERKQKCFRFFLPDLQERLKPLDYGDGFQNFAEYSSADCCMRAVHGKSGWFDYCNGFARNCTVA